MTESFRTAPAEWAATLGVDIGMVAWACTAFCLLGLVLGIADRMRRDLAPVHPRDGAVLLLLAATLVVGSIWALPSAQYNYSGHDAQLVESLRHLSQDPAELPPDPGVDSGSNTSRLFFGAAAGTTQLYSRLFPATPNNLSGQFRHWLPLSLLIGVLALWLAYAAARGWGAKRWSAALGVGLVMVSPGFLFHSNCLTDHLLAALVTVAAVHLQARRLIEGRLLTAWGLIEGCALLGAGFYTRYTAAILVIPLALARMWCPRSSLLRRVSHVGGLGLGMGVLMLPELPRIARISPYLQQNHVFTEYDDEVISFLSFSNLTDSFSLGALADFLSPLGAPAFLVLVGLGLLTLAGQTTSLGRRALSVLLLSVALIIAVNFMHIHPGTRSVLHVLLLAPVFLAVGLQRAHDSRRVTSVWKWVGVTALLAAALFSSLKGTQVLQSDWAGERSMWFDEMASTVPELDAQGGVSQVLQWADGKPFNILTNDSGNDPEFLKLGIDQLPEQARYFGQPGILSSRLFVEHPTLYIACAADFRWGTAFRRSYFIRARRGFTLLPSFTIEGKWLVFIAGPPAAPPTPWRVSSDPS